MVDTDGVYAFGMARRVLLRRYDISLEVLDKTER